MEIEGSLQKWTNYISGWKERYFSLSNGVLYYSSTKNSVLKGQIHLKISNISQNEQDSLGIILDSGTKLLHLRAETITEKIRWFNALKASKAEIQEIDQSLHKMKNFNINPILLDEFIRKTEGNFQKEEKEAFFQVIDKFLKEIINQEAKLDSFLTVLVNKYDFAKDNESIKLVENIVEIASGLIKSVTFCFQEFEKERKNLEKLMKQTMKNNEIPTLRNSKSNSEVVIRESLDFFGGDLPSNDLLKTDSEKIENMSWNLMVSPSLEKTMESAIKFNEDYRNFLTTLKTLSPLKHKILTENPVFKTRALPLATIPNKIIPPLKDEDISFISLIKSFIGKNFENLPIPIYLNEPISLLQRCCEQFKYSDLLDKANENSDPSFRLAYIMAFSFAFYSTTLDRNKKPFIPLLGETFEYIDPQRNIKYFAEQVKSNCFAIHCSGKNFTFWSNTRIKMMFWGKNLEFIPIGYSHIKLKDHDDHYIYSRPVTSVENLMINAPYIDNYGEMTFENLNNKQKAELVLKKRGFNNKNAFEAKGSIFDIDGKLLYNLKGKWNKFLSIEKLQNDEVIFLSNLWENTDVDLNKNPYHFSNFTKELNHLNQENVLILPLSDSRFRSDQKGVEYGLIDQANEENKKLMEIQRDWIKNNENWQAKWFYLKEIKGEEEIFEFKNEYWEHKKN